MAGRAGHVSRIGALAGVYPFPLASGIGASESVCGSVRSIEHGFAVVTFGGLRIGLRYEALYTAIRARGHFNNPNASRFRGLPGGLRSFLWPV